MKVELNEVTQDEDIYPRQNISHRTVESYVEALKGGATFPPIEVQRVLTEEDGKAVEKLIILDGFHRMRAYREYNILDRSGEQGQQIKGVEATLWKEESLDKKKWLEELRVRSAETNMIHGDRLSSGDLKFQLLKIVKARPIERLNGLITELAKKLNYSVNYMSELIGEEVRKRKISRDSQIYRISLLGWAQEEIGKLFGVTQPQISKITNKFATEVWNIQDQFYDKGKSVEELAKFYNLENITTWAIVLQEKSDSDRFQLFGKPEHQDNAPRLYNIWNFSQCDPRLGETHPGQIPCQIVLNLLHYYTKQGEFVVDPMAGGGSTVDACLVMGRK